MKYIFTLTGLLICCTSFSQRYADLDVKILAPSSPFAVDTVEEFEMDILVTNLGPANITDVDSLFLYMTIDGETVLFPPQGDYQAFQADLASGGTFSISLPYTFSAEYEASEVSLCITFQPVNSASPIQDTNQLNNEACIVIQIGEQTSGLKEPVDGEFVISPNPASDKVSIISGSPLEAITVSDYSGKVVLRSEQNEKSLDCSAWPAGVYYLAMQTQEGRAVKKLVVTR